MTALPPGPMSPNWGQILSSVGAGLSAAGSPQGGWSAFAPAVMNAQQNYQANAAERRRFQLLEQQAKRAQEQWEAEQRTANQEAARREQQDRLWSEFVGPGMMSLQPARVGHGGGLMQTASSPMLGSGPMAGDYSAIPPHARRAAQNLETIRAELQQTNNPRTAAKSLSNIPNGSGADGIPGTADDEPIQQAGSFNLTSEQRQLLAVLGPDEGMKILTQTAFAEPMDTSTDDMREYQQAVDQGYKGSFLDYQTALRQAGRSQNIVNMPGNPTPDEIGRKAFAEANAKGQAEYFGNVVKAGQQAQTRLGDINQLVNLIETTPQGAGQEWMNKGAAVLNRFGVDTSEFTNVPAAQAFQSIVSRLAPTLRVTGSGATSDFEMQQFLMSLPAIANMPDGNRIIARNLKKISERSVQEAYIANQVQAGTLSPSEGTKKILDLGALDLDLPSFGSAPPVGGPGGAPAIGGGTADDPLGLFQP